MSNNYLEEIHYFRVPVNNLEQSLKWYTEVLGLQLRFTQDNLAVLALKSGALYVLVEADHDSQGHFTVNGHPEFSVGFTTTRIRELHSYLAERDVRVEPIQEDQGHNFFCFYDPSGNKLQVHN
ncbi:VOC family protein [Ornithinibacillus scapharcae]|uniref:VOC family protein n=1 Tax=Ornithinibacillus scapharcae TaxID=1147159 RepID=UPI000225B312|nr:VOC family protein [Ornithinibacillus scapharcae]